MADAEQAATSPDSTEAKGLAEEAKARATAKVAELEAQLAAAEAELQPKRNAVVAARAEAAAAEAARVAAVEGAGNAEHALEPVSVFISRDTQRLYVRQAFQPILEIPVTIRDSNPNWHACLHRRGASRQERDAVECCLIGRKFQYRHSRDVRADA